MTKYRVPWSASGEFLVSEAADAEHAAAVVAEAVNRAIRPIHTDGTSIEVKRYGYDREAVSAEDG